MEWYVWLSIGIHIGVYLTLVLWYITDTKEQFNKFSLLEKISSIVIIFFWEVIVIIVYVKDKGKIILKEE